MVQQSKWPTGLEDGGLHVQIDFITILVDLLGQHPYQDVMKIGMPFVWKFGTFLQYNDATLHIKVSRTLQQCFQN